jgi:hypothetical protein
LRETVLSLSPRETYFKLAWGGLIIWTCRNRKEM